MSKLKTIRKRIVGVKSTKKITRAMQMVAAVQMRKAKDEADRQAIYMARAARTLGAALQGGDAEEHPLLKPAAAGKPTACLLVAGERGLCGGFNAQLFRFMDHLLKTGETPIASILVWGRKGDDHYHAGAIRLAWPAGVRPSRDEGPAWIRHQLVEFLLSGRFGSVSLVYNRFVNPTVQKPILEPLLPIRPPATEGLDALLEPDRQTVIEHAAIHYLDAMIGHALLETRAGELSARMTAMDNATKNADEMIDHLTLKYNQARQGAITKEILEVVGGAEAMKG